MGCSPLNVSENSQNQITTQEIRRIFQTFDQKCSGQLTCEELNQLLLQENVGVPPELLKAIIQIADYNDDNVIQLQEFSKLITILLSSYTIEELIMKFITKKKVNWIKSHLINLKTTWTSNHFPLKTTDQAIQQPQIFMCDQLNRMTQTP
ncbi:Calmodulin [Hexamita inflata]|uniref:Calmodulin n=1 Tax=Hexamita inflata TaxID=28002 RepID=A0AA86TYH4_9EUKA|nr:Calmodulin [Hexamita inflata]